MRLLAPVDTAARLPRLQHTIVGYSLIKGIGDGEPIASERFFVGGHEWVSAAQALLACGRGCCPVAQASDTPLTSQPLPTTDTRP